MAKSGLEAKVGDRLEVMMGFRRKRNLSTIQQGYLVSIEKLNKVLDLAIKEAEKNPEDGLAVARRCSRAMLEFKPDLPQDPARAKSLRQYQTLAQCLALVRQPGQYLAQMQEQFGPTLDPRKHMGDDAFNTIIKSQRRHLYTEGQGFNAHEEKLFCRKRSELLFEVEKAYNRLRDQALGGPAPDQHKGLGR